MSNKFKAKHGIITPSIESGDVTVDGNVLVSGTVDGRDIAADGSKLDGIAAGAEGNVATNLSITNGTTAGPIINSSTGSNATLPTASATASGVVTTAAQTWAGVKTFNSTIAGSISGNAGTATALQTARTIGGVSFDGTANINLPGVNAVGNQNTTGSAATLTTGRTIAITGDVTYTSGPFNGSGNVTGTATLANSGVAAGSYGGSTSIPVLTIDAKGRVTAASTSSISVGNGTLTLATSGIATGSQTFTANQATAATFTVNVPGTAIAQGTRTTTTVPITSSTGTNATLSAASTTLAGVMTSADKTKLDGIAAGAEGNVATNLTYTTATTTGTVNSSTGTDATIPAATTSLAGLMTNADKTKLDGIAAGANNFSLPKATSTVRGGVELASDTVQSVAANAVSATASRSYGVQLNSADQMVVNVPWVDTNTVVTITNDTSTNATVFPTFLTATSGTMSGIQTSSTKFTFNPSTGDLSATNFNSLSDETKKKDIETIVNAVELLLQLRGVTFKWKETDKASLGLIAQEVETVLPQVVTTLEDGTKTVSYGNIIGLLIEGFKNHEERINILEKLIIK